MSQPPRESPTLTVARVSVTPEAADLLRRPELGDGSSPMCYPDGEFITGDADVRLGDLDIAGPELVPVWMSREQFGYWSHTHLTIDVVPGRGAGFSLEAPTGRRFLTRSRLFTEAETQALESQPPG